MVIKRMLVSDNDIRANKGPNVLGGTPGISLNQGLYTHGLAGEKKPLQCAYKKDHN